MKIEGDYRKPTWKDLVIVRTFQLPYTALLYAKQYHRRYISTLVSILCVLCVCVCVCVCVCMHDGVVLLCGVNNVAWFISNCFL